MTNKVFRNFLIIGILGLMLFWPGFSLAVISLAAPCGIDDVPTTVYFVWSAAAGVYNYGLNIREEGKAWVEERIKPADFCNGQCQFPALELKVTTLTYLADYTWKVIAYDAAGNPIDSSGECSFTTQSAPAPPGDGVNGGPPVVLINPLDCDDLICVINAIINFLFFLVMALAPLMIIWAAFLILTSGGRAEQVNKGKTIILWTLVAVAIVLLAKGLPAIIKGVLGG